MLKRQSQLQSDGFIETRGGARLAYSVFGDGLPVLLLHGGGQTRHSWTRTARALAGNGYRAFCLDARGHGDSEWTSNYGLDLFAEDLSDAMAQLSPDAPPAIIGASLGGLTGIVALGGESRAPAAALVLVDIAVRIRREGSRQIRNFMAAHAEGFATAEAAAEAVSYYMTDRARPANIAGLLKNLRERDGRLFWHWDPKFIMGSGDGKRKPYDPSRLADAAAQIDVPMLLIRGEHSAVVDKESIAHMHSLVPQLETAEVAGAGHMVAGDANTPFMDEIIAFLARHYRAL